MTVPTQGRRKVAFGRIGSAALANCEAILRQWLPDGRVQAGEYLAKNPRRNDRRPGSFSINIRTGRWADFATGDSGGDLISLGAFLFDMSQAEAAMRLAQMVGVSPYEN